MPKPTVESIIDTIIKHEGGYSNDKKDDGNYLEGKVGGTFVGTNFGIAAPTLAKHRGKPVTADDMYFLTEDEAREIYRKQYVAPVLKLNPPPEAIPQMVDMWVNHGPGRAAKLIQRTVGATEDGAIGPKTMEKIRNYQGNLNNDLATVREQFYNHLMTSNPDKYGHNKGWIPRARSFRDPDPAPAGPGTQPGTQQSDLDKRFDELFGN